MTLTPFQQLVQGRRSIRRFLPQPVEREKILACLFAQAAGADFVKTSTGFGPGGATREDVELMRRVVGAGTGVKAAGGIRTYQDSLAMIAAGANRIGASAGVSILNEAMGATQ